MASDFSTRLHTHPYIANEVEPPGRRVLAVDNQLLIGPDVIHNVPFMTLLKSLGWVPVPSLAKQPLHHVSLYWHPELFHPVGRNVFMDTATLRSHLPLMPNQVSPNHVLIPALLDHSCPYGPPYPGIAEPLPQAGSVQPVTVIDSGYQWDDQNWIANPLAGRFAEYEVQWVYTPSATPPNAPGGLQNGVADTPGEYVVAGGQNRLCALAGHANFITGLIIQACPSAHVTIANHNGAYQPNSADFATEYSVVSALQAATSGPNQSNLVIDLGYSFWPTGGIPSCLWPNAFQAIGANGAIIVAPAGNQSDNAAYYPAAMATFFPNVIAVASHSPGSNAPSTFSNYGTWVTCSAVGEKAETISTFLNVDMFLEDGADGNPAENNKVNFPNAWASWAGTSFATAKVVGHIAAQVQAKGSAAAAWNQVKSTGPADPAKKMGRVLPF